MSAREPPPARTSGRVIVLVFLLTAGALGFGIRHLLDTQPPGSRPAPAADKGPAP